MLLLHSFDTEDEDIETLLVDALSKIPSSVELGFIVVKTKAGYAFELSKPSNFSTQV